MQRPVCKDDEARYSNHGWSFCYPAPMQVREHGEPPDVSLSDLTDERNFFGYKLSFRVQPLEQGQSLGDAFKAAIDRALKGNAKSERQIGEPEAVTMAGREGKQVRLSYVLDARHVEYTAPDGTTREAGGDPTRIVVHLAAIAYDDDLVTVQLNADAERATDLKRSFERVIETLRAEDGR